MSRSVDPQFLAHNVQNLTSSLRDLEHVLPFIDDREQMFTLWRALADVSIQALTLADRAGKRTDDLQTDAVTR